MTTALVRPHRSWMPALSLIAAGVAVTISMTALVVAADDGVGTTSRPAAITPAVPAPQPELLCDLRAGITRC